MFFCDRMTAPGSAPARLAGGIARIALGLLLSSHHFRVLHFRGITLGGFPLGAFLGGDFFKALALRLGGGGFSFGLQARLAFFFRDAAAFFLRRALSGEFGPAGQCCGVGGFARGAELVERGLANEVLPSGSTYLSYSFIPDNAIVGKC